MTGGRPRLSVRGQLAGARGQARIQDRAWLALALERAGADVESAENGKVGVELATCREYDLILMDIGMPEPFLKR